MDLIAMLKLQITHRSCASSQPSLDFSGSAHGAGGCKLFAIHSAAENCADLVVMDIVMPRMDGLTALRTLRVSNPGIRVAMLSSVAGSRSRAEEAFRLGAVQVLTKPVDPVKLRELLAAERAAKASAGG